MKKRRGRWLLAFLAVIAVAMMGGIPFLEAKDPLTWRRFKRHMGYAFKWQSMDQLVAAVSPPKTRRVAAVAPYNAKAELWVTPKSKSYVAVGTNASWLYPPGGSEPVELLGDIEWELMAPADHYLFVMKVEGCLSRVYERYWSGSSDIDLGKMEFLFGDLDGDDLVTAQEADLAESLVGEKVERPPAQPRGRYYYYYQIGAAKHLADIDRDGVVEEWEAETIRKSVGKRGEAREKGLNSLLF